MEAEIFNRSALVFRAALSVGQNFSMLWFDAAAEARGEPERTFATPMDRERVMELVKRGEAHRPVWAPKIGARERDDFEWRVSGASFLHISFDAPAPEKLRERLRDDKAFRAAAREIAKEARPEPSAREARAPAR